MTENPSINFQEQIYKDPGVIAVIQKYAPEFEDRFLKIDMPTVSSNPDEMETWENQAIDKRRQRTEHEGDFAYTLRALYEETFSVNQFARAPFKRSNGLTVGGLISHFYSGSQVSGVSLEDATNWKLIGKSLSEVLLNIENYGQREKIFNFAELTTFPIELGRGGINHLMRLSEENKTRLLKDPGNNRLIREDIDTYGFRFMKLVNLIPELTEEVTDPQLLALVNFPEGRKITRIQFFSRFWKRVSGLVLDEHGYYKIEGTPGVSEGLRDLAMIRTHPEFKFLYRYKSPSGFINDNNT